MDESLNALKKLIDTYFGLIFKIGIVITILSSFFLFTNLTTEFYDTPKFLILFLFTSLGLTLLTLKFVALGKVVLVRTPLDLPLLLLLVVAIVSTVLSPSPYVALLGHQLKVHGSLISILVYVIFYFVLVNNLKSLREVKWILYLSLVASQVLAAISLIAYFGVKILPPPWTHTTNFTTTGSSFSTTAVLAMLLPLVVVQILSDGKLVAKVINGVFLTVMGVTIALTGTWATWIVAVVGFVVTFYLVGPIRQISQISQIGKSQLISLVTLIVPVVIVALVTTLSFVPPLGGAKNLIYTQAQTFPREVQLPLISSWKISISAFRDIPFWGSGPSTFLFDFTNYKPIEFNSTKMWNVRFDSPFNEYLLVLATLGGIGFLALISLTALFITSTVRSITEGKHPYISALAVSGLSFFALLAIHPSTVVLWIIGLLILASFMVVNMSQGQKSWSNLSNLNIKNAFAKLAANVSSIESSTETIRIDALPGVLFTVVLALVLFGLFYGGKYTLADYHHRLALNAVSQNQGVIAYNELIAAEKLNPVNDLYRSDIAQINFALANSIALSKAPSEASPGGSLTAQDAQNIQTLLQQSINEARTATSLSPRSAINWEILGLLYRQISGVAQNALVFSLDSYGRAIFQDPLNPVLRLNVGGTYYAIKNYDLAIRFFTDAINLKPDFANGYYNLSVALRDKGDLNSALAAANKMMEFVDVKSADYKVASDYLADLQNKITPPTPAEPPAAETSGALQQEELPKVVNVGNPPENIATPTAVKKPNSTPEPTATP